MTDRADDVRLDLQPMLGDTDPTPVRVRIEALDAAIRLGGPDEWDGSLTSDERVSRAIYRAEVVEAWLRRAGLPDGPAALAAVVEHALGKVEGARELVAVVDDDPAGED